MCQIPQNPLTLLLTLWTIFRYFVAHNSVVVAKGTVAAGFSLRCRHGLARANENLKGVGA